MTRLRETERWFIKRGLPHFIHDYNAREDVLTRSLPILVLYFVFSFVAALRSEWPWWGNLLAAAGGFALLLSIWAFANRMRGRRPLLRLPERVGVVELTVFVLGPALVALIIGAQWRTALWTVVAAAGFLIVVYLVTSYGVVPMVRWGAGRVLREVGATVRLFSRALPLLLLFTTFLFINAEVWQVTSRLSVGLLVTTGLLFLTLGLLFLLARLPREVAKLGEFRASQEVARLLADTPMAEAPADAVGHHDLSRRQRVNVSLLLLFAQVIQILLVSALVGAFFVLFGLVIMRPETMELWTGNPIDSIGESVKVFGGTVVLSAELLRAAAFLAGFAGLYFAVTALTDATYREEFFEEITVELREALAVREAYLAEVEAAA